MSVSFSDVSTLMFRLPGVSFAQCSLAATTPDETLPSTLAFRCISPRRLNAFTVSPSRMPRGSGVRRIHLQQSHFLQGLHAGQIGER